jgi:hypothetical protein
MVKARELDRDKALLLLPPPPSPPLLSLQLVPETASALSFALSVLIPDTLKRNVDLRDRGNAEDADDKTETVLCGVVARVSKLERRAVC